MFKALTIFFLLFFLAITARGQIVFLKKVKVQFEKTVYLQQYHKELYPDGYELIKETIPETIKYQFEFLGDSVKSLYKPLTNSSVTSTSRLTNLADKNVISIDFKTGLYLGEKQVFDEKAIVKDKIFKIAWKLTGDTRVIAGFECKKAIGILNDSIGIYAFFTEEILIPGGPENINGLPGMILGVGIPRLHATWFATKVQIDENKLDKSLQSTNEQILGSDEMIKVANSAVKKLNYTPIELLWFII